MKPIHATAASVAISVLAVLAAPAPAAADGAVSGHWRVAGKVSGFAFTLNCDFQQAGAALTGVCVDVATNDPKIKGGRRHPLTKGAVDGDNVSFSYESSFLLTRFSVDFAGLRQGDHMAGKISGSGQSGAFTADRL